MGEVHILGRDNSGRCSKCGAREVGVCGALEAGDLLQLATIATHRRLAKGDVLFGEDGVADRVYVVMQGALRLTRLLADGRRCIVGFALQGDFVGYSTARSFLYGAEALQPSVACAMPRSRFESLMTEMPHLMSRVCGLTIEALSDAQGHMVALARQSVEERMAAFLLQLETRTGACGFDGGIVNLPMSRADLADYLGMTLETASRCLNAWRRDGLLEMESPRRLRLLNRDRMQALATGEETTRVASA